LPAAIDRLNVFSIGKDGAGDPCGSREVKLGGRSVRHFEQAGQECRLHLVDVEEASSGDDFGALCEYLTSTGIAGVGIHAELSPPQLQSLSTLKHLRYLDLSDNVSLDDAALAQLTNLPDLEYLYLNRCQNLSASGLRHIARFGRLRCLRLAGNKQLTDAEVDCLAELQDLSLISMQGSTCGDAAVAALAGLPKLTHIWLGRSVTDQGLKTLGEFPALRSAPVAAERFLIDEYSIPSPSFVSMETLAGRPITDEGLGHLTELSALHGLFLWTFRGKGSSVSAKGIQRLNQLSGLRALGCMAAACDNETLALMGDFPGLEFLECQDGGADDTGFSALAGCHSLKAIWGGKRCDGLTARGLRELAKLPALAFLAVGGAGLDNEAFSVIPQFTALRELWPMGVDDAAFASVAAHPQIEKIVNMYCESSGDPAARQVSRAPSLECYQMWSTAVTDDGIAALQGAKRMKTLSLYRCNGVSDRGVEQMRRMASLQHVDFVECPHISREAALSLEPRIAANYQAARS